MSPFLGMTRNENEVFTYEKGHRNYIKIDGKIVLYAVYVAKTNPDICGKWSDGCEVHHLNGNSLDDRPENLIVLSREDHHKIHRKSVDAFYLGNDGVVYLGRFPGISAAAADLNINDSAISYYCKYNKPLSSSWTKWRFSYVK